ncbi:uncharacterized protein DNG_01390 [Cephalotrichum gorgonifer]|uniref:DUF803 domain-containing protein n=1 Tax=Cephalotrichum gorgonifer TaxID=2041049 RepID=A0AAE8SS94_9PEZI|nr:uncharacterized protein DNG_01390 [Cephalotrichum gorgonifer]
MRDLTASQLASAIAVAYSNTTDPQPEPQPDHPDDELRNWSSLIGIITAIVGNVLIALALNVQRYAHIRLHRERARIKERAKLAGRRTPSSQYSVTPYGAVNNNGSAADARPRTSYFDGHDELWGHGGRATSRSLGSASAGRGDEEGHSQGSSYLRSPYWWLGQVLITLGEMGNFLAYGFAPASIVSPLGVVALISNCVIAPILFNEKFRQRDFMGVVIAVGGVVTVVLSANQQETKLEPHDVWEAISTLEFEVYLAVTIFLIVTLMWISSTYAHRTILVDLGLVGLFGGYTALATKGVSSMISATLWRAFTTPVTYALILILLATAIMQIRYVNKALQRSDSTVVIPIQFVMFTLCVIIGSAVLYRDFERTTPLQAVKFIGGCLLTFFGVFLITSGRASREEEDEEESYLDVDDSEETIGLLRQDQTPGSHPLDTPDGSDLSRTSSISSRSPGTNYSHGFINPLKFQLDSGLPSQRTPQHEAARVALSKDMPHPGPSPWVSSDEDEAGGAGALSSTSVQIGPLDLPPGLPYTEPSTPQKGGADPLQLTTTTSRPTTAKIHGRRLTLTGPLISPSPLSSTVSAVVKDTLRRQGDGPMLQGTSLSRIRSSIRASLFISDEDDDDENERGQPSGLREPLLGDLTDVDEGCVRLALRRSPAMSAGQRNADSPVRH